MKKMIRVMLAIVICLSCSTAWAQATSDLRIVRIDIVPNSVVDLKDGFFRDRPMLQVAPVSEEDSEKLRLPRYRSYRFIVTIEVGRSRPADFIEVSTQGIRDGKTVTLGKARIGLENRRAYYACYDVFPAEAGPGDCTIRTLVKADDQNDALEFNATIPD